MKPSGIFRAGWLLTLVLMIALLVAPIRAQESVFVETFDDPALPGWERSPGAAVVDGVLRIEPGNFAFHGGEWGDATLTVRVRRSGEGGLALCYRTGDAGAYHILVEAGYLALQREASGAVAELGGVLLEFPVEGWFQLGVTAAGAEHTVTLDPSAGSGC